MIIRGGSVVTGIHSRKVIIKLPQGLDTGQALHIKLAWKDLLFCANFPLQAKEEIELVKPVYARLNSADRDIQLNGRGDSHHSIQQTGINATQLSGRLQHHVATQTETTSKDCLIAVIIPQLLNHSHQVVT